MTTYNPLTNGTISSTDTANELYAEFIKFDSPKIADVVKDRMDNIVFNGKTKAINSYNSILTYVAAEAVIAAIENGDILSSGLTTSKPTKLNPSVNNLTVAGDITASSDVTVSGVITASGGVTGTVSSLSNHDTDSLSEGTTNLFFTDARGQAAIEGHNSIGTSASSDITIGKTTGADVTIAGALTLSGAPTSDLHAATKAYVDGVAEGLQIKPSVKVATTADGTLTSAFVDGVTIDGISIETGDRILIKEQTDAKENGIYIVNASGAPTRTDDFDTNSSAKGAFVFVEEGTTNADKGFVCTSDEGNDTVGTHNLGFTQFSGAGSITISSGTGVTVATSGSSNTISIGQPVGTTDDVTFGTVNANSVDINGGNIDGTTIGANSAAAGTFSSMTATAVDINSGYIDNTVIGGTTPAAGTFSAINHSAAIARSGNSELTANTASLVDIIEDLYAKITYKDEVITALLQQIDLSDSISSSNPFYTGAYTGTNSVTASYSLDYTAS